ncbi:family 20 glycosylhydrolase [Luteimonas sp. Y-2-2-4F]|nr:family 20 glycosylhydrolase [Luteimonas sp. Y-2-2-4F]MCD9033213.1 family 20 glycosylhydrolase [Luteimonas sp. Y-2-2-4F]
MPHDPLRLAALACALLALSACSGRPPTAPAGEDAAAPSAAAAAHGPQAEAGYGALVPLPASVAPQPGRFVLDGDTRYVAEGEGAQAVAERFAELLARSRGLRPAASREPGAGLRFRIDPALEVANDEGYRLRVGDDAVEVTARTAAGLQHGATTLWQLAGTGRTARVELPGVRIDDAPRFGWRGLMLDSARHFQSVDEIKRLLDAMALHKLNTFHWHLTDDQGWRIEIERYPRLTEVGGCRIPAGDGGVDPATGKPVPYCGHYTQDQIREVVAYAAARHIAIVPEINMPGHAQAAVAAYPELGVTGEPLPVLNEWGVNTTLFNVEERTFAFLENVLAEVVELFPGRYVHVGGDEAVKDQWEASPRVQARMRELGAADEAAMQSLFVGRMARFLEARGRRLIGWDEILDGGLPPEATVMSWRGIEGGIAAARMGHDVVMTPVSDLYLDYLQTDSPDEPPGRPATNTLQKIYAFEPVPAALTAQQAHHVLGVQANLWTEHVRSFERVQHHVFPRIAALSEIAWTPAARRDWAGFLDRLPAQLARYRATGIAYAQTPFQVQADAREERAAGRVEVTLRNPLGYPVRYTTDGSAPTAASSRYERPLDLALPAAVRAAAFHGDEALAAPSLHRYSAERLLARSDRRLVACPGPGSLRLRLEDDGPLRGPRDNFDVDIFYPCWLWEDAELDGVVGVSVRAGRMPYAFQLAHDEPARRFAPATAPHGELRVHSGGCEGPVVAEVPLPEAPGADGFVVLDADLPASTRRTDLCLVFTGDTRPTMWVIDEVRLRTE